ncbi:MAG: GNAT family N-acetyltransferase [Acidimicrobiia bacterium]|nr:GNAT family N-acetyltransferase [Acidimicrobiia bacterium]MDH4365419.1 GNAT family N-acetyltransferase [Acidimicrobiia bacterium]
MALTSPGTPGAVPVAVWSLATTAPPPPAPPPPDPRLRLVVHVEPSPEVSRDFYRQVGAGWYWVDRSDRTDDQWRAWVDRPEHRLVTCWQGGDEPVGYYELEQQAGGVVELVYFGLLPAHHGRGIGRWLLARAMADAWALLGTTRLCLHTCSLDGPNARANYYTSHTGLTRRVHAYLRWRNDNARAPEVLAALRKRRAEIRAEQQRRWGRPRARSA